jgi:hypothetical protein
LLCYFGDCDSILTSNEPCAIGPEEGIPAANYMCPPIWAGEWPNLELADMLITLILSFMVLGTLLSFSLYFAPSGDVFLVVIDVYTHKFCSDFALASASFLSSFSYSWSCFMKPGLGHTMDLFDLVKLNASHNPIPFSFIR